MTLQKMQEIFEKTAYVRMGGSKEELECAKYLMQQCEELGLQAHLEDFPVEMAVIEEAVLLADGQSIPCKGYLCAGSGEVEAPLYYLSHTDKFSLKQCKGKIVLTDKGMGYWKYQDILEQGAVGFITYDGNANYVDEDIDHKELRSYVSKGNKIPGVNINAKSAIKLVEDDVQTVKIILKQKEWEGNSRNVVVDIPGETEEMVVLTAHYDSTSLSQGAYDNMSGSIGLLGIAEYFLKKPHHYSLRFIWCGSEERGLLGAKAYVKNHEEELAKMVLNVNLDMIGSIMGNFHACCTTEEKLVHFLEYFGNIEGMDMKVAQDVYSSDSTPFADAGVPALSFARLAPNNTATIHNRYDTLAVMKMEHMEKDIAFICKFVDCMANAKACPVGREIPENMKEKLDIYLLRKRDK